MIVVEIFLEILAFIERGGDVLFAIFGVTFLMWMLVLERFFYLFFEHPRQVKRCLTEWTGRREKQSWYSVKIREYLISELSQRLHHSLPIIKTLIAICPLLGLLGTVTGMIEVFDIMAAVGSGNSRAMAEGVSKATIPTMAGMVAALSGLFFSARLETAAQKRIATAKDRFSDEGGISAS